jgi:putative phosphonate metabolism protein
MEQMKRFAVYYAPEPGAFAAAAATWLGWDAAAARPVAQPALPMPLADWTAEPRRYGFHGTLKPPFRLAEGVSAADLTAALTDLARDLPMLGFAGLEMVVLDGFLALVPIGDPEPLLALAAEVVARLEKFRAPLTDAEIARRRPETLSPRQRELLASYGYPFVMEEFRFHLTLSGRLSAAEMAALYPLARDHFAPHLAEPFRIADLCLFGETAAGPFQLLHRCPLAG